MTMPKHTDSPQQEAPTERLQAIDYFDTLFSLASLPATPKSYLSLYSLLQNICESKSPQAVFSNLFSRLSYVCRHSGLTPAETQSMQSLRRKCHHLSETAIDSTMFLSDIRQMAEFVGKVFRCGIPERLRNLFPTKIGQEKVFSRKAFYPYLRVEVKKWDKQFIYAEKDEATNDAQIKIDYRKGGFDGDLEYIGELLKAEMPLNLLKTTVTEDDIYMPETIVVYPDYLIEVSSLAACFKEYGHSPINYILNRLQTHRNTSYTLLGQVSGLFLDNLINHQPGKEPAYADSIRKAFGEMPLPFALVNLNEHFRFHEEARRQFDNLQKLVHDRLEQDYGFQLTKTLIEPSFICEALGLSGRMDLLQSDYSKLVEQKSGKMDEFRHTHREAHFVQMMLYQAILEYGIGVSPSRTDTYLLYSKYTDGLMHEQTYKKLLREAIALRNRIVSQEMVCAQGNIGKLLTGLTPEQLCTESVGKLWAQYQRPELEKLLRPFQRPQTEREKILQSYFFRFYTFLCRENMMSKTTVPGNAGRAFSDLWNLPEQLRHELGGMYCNLRVESISGTDANPTDVTYISLTNEQKDDMCLSDFRTGDAVLLYRHDKEKPDVRHQFLMRGNISELKENGIVVKLRHPQCNKSIFGSKDARYAVEHDLVESSANRLFSFLYMFLTGSEDRQDLLLNRRRPYHTEEKALKGNYGALNDLIKKERSSRDLFFVIGPPGSGKTSRALRHMVEEELRNDTQHLLLMAYTNQAVDEICGMLDRICEEEPYLLTDYLRIGSMLTADKRYHQHFLDERCARIRNAGELRLLLTGTKVYVGTTSSISAQAELLGKIHFSVAFIDEASQILEPQMLGLLFARQWRDGAWQDSIGRFVMIGDQKQLPAVVQQSTDESAVKEACLQEIGLHDCRNSLFERLLAACQALHETHSFALLETQGRMHPQLFKFVNEHFYSNHLHCVPLAHQKRGIDELYPLVGNRQPALALSTNRMAFFHCLPDEKGFNGKQNIAEARLAVRCIKELQSLYKAHRQTLNAADVGIIVPYRNQIAAIRKEMERQDVCGLENITIDTVERFQGSQRDIIFYLFTVRHACQLQFLAASTYLEQYDNDEPYWVDRKLNVALTRAREQMFLIGNAGLLSHNKIYRQLINSLKEQGCYYDTNTF